MSTRVNGEELTPDKLEAEYQRLETMARARAPAADLVARQPELRKRARDIAIGRLLLLQEARRRELTVPENELAGALQSLIAAAGGAAAWTARVREKQIDYPQVWRELNDALLVEQIARQITDPVPNPSDEEIAFFYARHADEIKTADQPGADTPAPASPAAREQIRCQLLNERRNQALEAFIDQLRQDAMIEED